MNDGDKMLVFSLKILPFILTFVSEMAITEASCPTPPSLLGTACTYNATTVGSKAEYSCLHGYENNVTSTVTWECAGNDTWQGPVFTCTLMDCGPPPEIKNAFQTFYGSTIFKSEVMYQCWSGHTSLFYSQFNVTCTSKNGTAKWDGYSRMYPYCWKLNSYLGCYPLNVTINISYEQTNCLSKCLELNMPYAALRDHDCACLEAMVTLPVNDYNCSLPCGTGGLCGGDPDLWSVYATFHGCYSNVSTEGQFQALNNVTCREKCRGMDQRFAIYFMGNGKCRCLNNTDPTAIRRDLTVSINLDCSVSTDVGLATVYTIEKEPRVGSSCEELFKHEIFLHGRYYLTGLSSPVSCQFYDGTVCEDMWVGYKGSCYLWKSFTMSNDSRNADFTSATKYCAEQDSLLVSINDLEEAQFLRMVFQVSLRFQTDVMWFIGLYDHFRTLVSQWLDGSLFTYSGYASDQPNDLNMQCSLLANYPSGDVNTWYQGECDEQRSYICERSKGVYGCAAIPRGDFQPIYNFTDDNVMTLTLCFATCRTHETSFAAVSGSTCYCLNDLPSSHTNLSFTQCWYSCPGNQYQFCGNPNYINASEVLVFVIQEAGQAYARSCIELELQGITGPRLQVKASDTLTTCLNDSSGLCPYAWADKNGRCYKYFTQTGLDPSTICGRDFNSYLAVVDDEEEAKALFGTSSNFMALSSDLQWIIGLSNYQIQGVYRTSNGRALQGVIRPVNMTSLPCLFYDIKSSSIQGTACNAKPFICEKGPEYLGCAMLSAGASLVIYNYTDMSVTQCVETCRGRGNRYALLGNGSSGCYCTQTPPNTDASSCSDFCFSQICGGNAGSVSAYDVESFPRFANSCQDLYREGVLIHGTYVINGTSQYCYMKDNSTCSQVDTTLWMGVGINGACFKLSYYNISRKSTLQACKGHPSLSVPASFRSTEEVEFLLSTYNFRKDGYKRLPIQVGAQDQFQLGCFTWADGWLFDIYRWSAGFPNLNYSPTYDMGVDIYASLSYNNTLNNKYYTTGLPTACREVKDYLGCFINPHNLSAAIENYASMGLTLCKQTCLGKNTPIGLVDTQNCYCRSSLEGLVQINASLTRCDVPCPANSLQSCASLGVLRAYEINSLDSAQTCSTLHANFVVLENVYMLKNSLSGNLTSSTCGFADNTSCPAGFMGHKGKCYRFFPMKYKNATKAAEHCFAVGGYLATPRNAEEADFLRQAVDSVPSLSSFRKWRIGVVNALQGDLFSSSDGSLMRTGMWNETWWSLSDSTCSLFDVDTKTWMTSSCSMPLQFICETGPVFLGCQQINATYTSKTYTYRYNSTSLNVQQCIAICNGQDTRYTFVRNGACDCVAEADFNASSFTRNYCNFSCPDFFSQSCGSDNSDIVAVYDIGKYASEDKTAASCVEYFKYGVMAKGYYYLNISWKEFKSVELIFRFHNVKRVFCGYYGNKYQDIFLLEDGRAYFTSSAKSSNETVVTTNPNLMSWLTWHLDLTFAKPWLQVTLSDYYLIKAIAVTGCVDNDGPGLVKEFTLFHGLTSDTLYPYEETLAGISTTPGELAVRFLKEPFAAKVILVVPTVWSGLPAMSFTLLGESYQAFDHNDTFIGCFVDPGWKLFTRQEVSFITSEDCKNRCLMSGYGLFGLSSSSTGIGICSCATAVGEFGMLNTSSCSSTCGISTLCGSEDEMSVAVYRTYKKQCPTPPTMGNTTQTVRYLVNVTGVYTFGMSIVYTCIPWHVFPDETTSKEITCQQNNTWSGSIEACHMVFCPVPENITYGEVSYTTLHYGSQVTSQCDAEHQNRDGSRFVVSYCSEHKTWTPQISTCTDGVQFRKRIICRSVTGHKINGTAMDSPTCRSCLDCAARCLTAPTCALFTCRMTMTSERGAETGNCNLYDLSITVPNYVLDLSWDVYSVNLSC